MAASLSADSKRSRVNFQGGIPESTHKLSFINEVANCRHSITAVSICYSVFSAFVCRFCFAARVLLGKTLLARLMLALIQCCNAILPLQSPRTLKMIQVLSTLLSFCVCKMIVKIKGGSETDVSGVPVLYVFVHEDWNIMSLQMGMSSHMVAPSSFACSLDLKTIYLAAHCNSILYEKKQIIS